MTFQLTDQGVAGANQLITSLIELKATIEKVPGCESPTPPSIDPILQDFKVNVMEMMDRLTEQVRQTNKLPTKESTQL